MLSTTFLIFTVVAIMLGINILLSNKELSKYNIYFIGLCISSAMWSVGYSIMLNMTEYKYAAYARCIASLGISLYSPILYTIVIYLTMSENKKFRRISSAIVFAGSIFCYILLMMPGTAEFITVEFGTTYYLNNTFGRRLYVIFVALVLLCGYSSIIYWVCKTKYKREKKVGYILMLAGAVFATGAYFDAFRPIKGEYLFPSSCISQFMTLLIVYYMTRKYNTFEISYRNLSTYIYETVHTPILVLYPNNMIALANVSSTIFLGRKREDLLKQSFFDIFKIDEDSRKILNMHENKDYSIRAVCMGNMAICRLDISEIYDSHDEPICRLCIVNDITKEIETMKELEKSKEEAENANNAKSLFLANMSHEIRTPLNAIIGMSEILLRDETSTRQRNNINSIKNSGIGLLAIINDVLDLSKIESGKLEIIEDVYSVYSLLLDTANIISIRLNDKNVKFIMDIQPEIPAVLLGDSVRIKQILINLLGNAVKFTEEGYIRLNIYHKMTANNKVKLFMEISDTGIGIKPEDLPRIFSAYTQVDLKKNREIKGTGLGLSICKNLAEMMEGSVQVESVYGEGSTFKVEIVQKTENDSTLVNKNSDADLKIIVFEEIDFLREHFRTIFSKMNIDAFICENEKEFIHEILSMENKYKFLMTHQNISDNALKTIKMYCNSMGAKSVHLYGKLQLQKEEFDYNLFIPALMLQFSMLIEKGKIDYDEYSTKNEELRIIPKVGANVLIVDDNRVNLQVAEGLMIPYQMNVDTALNGKEAIQKIKERKYDLIFMDHMMPEMDGIETVRIIRKLDGEYFKTVPVIALTANALSSARKMFLDEGFQDFLAKPVEIRKLNAIINKWLVQFNKKDDSYIGIKNTIKEEKLDDNELIDIEKGIQMVGGVKAVYYEILKTYQEELKENVEMLDELLKNDLDEFVVKVHGIKSTSASMGADMLSLKAKDLEFAGKDKKIEYISRKLPEFKADARDVIDYISNMKME